MPSRCVTLEARRFSPRAQVAAQVERIAGALAALGVGRGDTVGLLLADRPEFNLVDAAAMHLGAVPWSIYATSSPEQIRRLIDGAGSRVVVTEAAFAAQMRDAAAGSAVEHVLRVEELERWPDAPTGFQFDELWRHVSGEDVLTIIWTSGTTGAPKGVELTHAGCWRRSGQSSGWRACVDLPGVSSPISRPRTSPIAGPRTTGGCCADSN